VDQLPWVKVSTEVIRDSGLTVVARLLYAVIASYADLQTLEATLLRSTLAKAVGKSRDTVDRAVADLVKAGLLEVTNRRNDSGVLVASTFRLTPPRETNQQAAGMGTGAHTPGGTNAPTPGGMGMDAGTGMGTGAGMGTDAHTGGGTGADTVWAPVRQGYGHGCGKELEPLNESQGTRETLIPEPDGSGVSETTRQTLEDHFAEFWAAYPRKVGKQNARKVWDRKRRDTPIAVILAGARRYRDDPNLPEENYRPHPSTWLARGGWEDDPCPPRRATTGPVNGSANGARLSTTDQRMAQAQAVKDRFRARQQTDQRPLTTGDRT